MIGLIMVSGVLLALIILIKTCGSRWLGSNTEEKITIVFCGFKKSLASGITKAKILFSGHAPGAVVLPLMLFQQIQRMVCAMLAQRYSLCPLSSATTPPHRPSCRCQSASAGGMSSVLTRQIDTRAPEPVIFIIMKVLP